MIRNMDSIVRPCRACMGKLAEVGAETWTRRATLARQLLGNRPGHDTLDRKRKEDNMKTLIAYATRYGSTTRTAELLAEVLGKSDAGDVTVMMRARWAARR